MNRHAFAIRRLRSANCHCCRLLALVAACSPGLLLADGAGPLLKLLQSGKLPPERLPAVVEMVCKKGNAEDLAYVFGQVLDPQAYSPELRLKTLGYLADAAAINKVRPAGDLSAIEQLLADGEATTSPTFALAVLRLASLWRVPSIADELRRIATAEKVDDKLQAAAIDGLASIGDAASQATLKTLAASGRPARLRFRAVAGLAGCDLTSAANSAAVALAESSPQDDPTALVQAFLNRKGGADALGAAVASARLPGDVAKVALRTMYSAGRSDSALSDVLSTAAGIALDEAPPTGEALQKICDDVLAKGDPERGERIFRRADLNCMKCHCVSGGGGTVGPDLSPIGGTSPVDYIVNSILNPNLVIKELYVTKIIATVNGQAFTGIVVDRNDHEVKLKDANGQIVVIPTADIDEEADGKSLMPQGVTKFLTHEEVLDLARFVSELGKAGPYGIRKTLTVQRWRAMKNPPDQIQGEVPNIEFLRELVFAASPDAWTPAFGKVAGVLPLDELRSPAGSAVVFLQTEFNVVEPGSVGLSIDSTEPTHLWIDAAAWDTQTKFITDLTKGPHTLTIRVAIGAAQSPELKAEFFQPAGSTAQLEVQ